MSKKLISFAAGSAALIISISGAVFAHDVGVAGEPVCLEANFMMADAMNSTPNNPPFASAQGPGRVLEMNIFTGERGITVDTPFNGGNTGSAVCPASVPARVHGSQQVYCPAA